MKVSPPFFQGPGSRFENVSDKENAKPGRYRPVMIKNNIIGEG